ncbi:MAG: hypothetical protein ABIL58_14240 [Pseudomonadota bacterium]
MTEQTERRFQINGGDASQEDLYREERSELRLERLNNKVTLITILLPILIIVVLVVSYLDIKRKVSTVEVTGNTEYQQLSADAASKFSSLSLKYASLEENLGKQMQALDKGVASLSSAVKQVESNTNRLRTEKASETDVKKIAADLNAAVSSLQKDLKTMDANIEALDLAVNDQLKKLLVRLELVDNRLIEQEAQIVTVSSGTVDRVTLNGELKLLEERIAQNRGKDLKMLQLSLEDIQRQVAALQGNTAAVPSAAPSSAAAPKPATTSQPAPTQSKPPTPAKTPAPTPSAPKQGQILEQPLK